MAETRGVNRFLGWVLLVVGCVGTVWLAARSPGAPDPALRASEHALAGLLGMALAQLAVAHVLGEPSLGARTQWVASGLTGAGAAVYAVGDGAQVLGLRGAWLVPAGALLTLSGMGALAAVSGRVVQSALITIALGMLLDALLGLLALRPGSSLLAFLGPEDGLRLRMLRLARAAAVALPILLLLFEDLAARSGSSQRAVRGGRAALLGGAIGLPTFLTLTALTTVRWKYLLPLPADAVFGGTVCGAWLARRQERRLELAGWLLVAASMAVGLLMGVYAFDGPLRSPAFMGAYGDFPRRLARMAHADAIMLGLACLFAARERSKREGPLERQHAQISRG